MKQIWWNAFLSDSDAARPCRFLTPEGISASRLVPLGQRKLGSISLANKKIIEILFHLLRQHPLFATKARQPDTLCRISHTGTGTPWGTKIGTIFDFCKHLPKFFLFICFFFVSLQLHLPVAAVKHIELCRAYGRSTTYWKALLTLCFWSFWTSTIKTLNKDKCRGDSTECSINSP